MAVKAYALTTAQRMANYSELGTLAGADLTLMELLVNQVTDYIESYTGIRFKRTTYTQEMYDTEESETLNLKHHPIVSGTDFSLERRTSSLNEDDWEVVDSEYYHIDNDTGIIISAAGLLFGRTIRGYRVTYTAGYDFDNATTFLSDTEAGDIELAAWMLLDALWNKKKGGGSIVESERIGDYSVTYKKATMENNDVKAILDKYADTDNVGVITPLQA